MKTAFTKWQGCGNDFILLEDMEARLAAPGKLSKRLCDRHFGIGGDGLILLLPSDRADIRMRIFNADGSEAEMCGNGIRCFARLAFERGLVPSAAFTVETGAGVLRPEVQRKGGRVTGVRVDMGRPVLEANQIPIAGFDTRRVEEEPLEVLDRTFSVTGVSMGNPHCVIFLEDLEEFPVAKYGPVLEKHEWFPRRTNVEFAVVRDRKHIRMRVWERGAAVTMACGTGACATLVAAALTGRTNRAAEVALDGGRLFIEWAESGRVYMTGPAEMTFAGEIEI